MVTSAAPAPITDATPPITPAMSDCWMEVPFSFASYIFRPLSHAPSAPNSPPSLWHIFSYAATDGGKFHYRVCSLGNPDYCAGGVEAAVWVFYACTGVGGIQMCAKSTSQNYQSNIFIAHS